MINSACLDEENNHACAQCGKWLISISQEDSELISNTREYREFMRLIERMKQAHRQSVPTNQSNISTENSNKAYNNSHPFSFEQGYDSPVSFIQIVASDDIILRILDFVECRDLFGVMKTCSRLHDLVQRSAKARTQKMARVRHLDNDMQLLRAQEQIEGIGCGEHDKHVPIPILLLRRRVIVQNSGDPDYNGIYFCTGTTGNGFLFTKPRYPEQRVPNLNTETSNIQQGSELNTFDGSTFPLPGQLLRCKIAKEFSEETLFWFMSKEVIATEDTEEGRAGDIIESYAFWAKLMDDSSDEEVDSTDWKYPSQTSVLTSGDGNEEEGWQRLLDNSTIQPPTVELLD